MPSFPVILAQPNLPELQLPRTNADAYGAGVFATLGEVAAGMAKSGQPIEAAKNASAYDDAIDGIKNEVATLDPNTRRDEFIKREAEARKALAKGIGDSEVKSAFDLHVARRLGPNLIDVNGKALSDTHAQQRGDILIVRGDLSKKAAEADDPKVEQSYTNAFNAMVAGASSPVVVGGKIMPGALSPKEAQEQRAAFQKDVLEHFATKVLRTNPDKMHSDEIVSRLAPLGEVRILELQSKARDVSLQIEARSDAVTAKNQKTVIDAAEAQANFGKLNKDWLNEALAGNNPLVRPSEARRLQGVNDNPPSGGDASAKAIWDDYTSGPRTIGRIEKAREQLNRLPISNDKLKYKNELQSDLTTMQNQGIAQEANAIARDNRQIHDLKNEYDAWVQSNPIINSIMGNMATHEKAQIESIFKKDGPEAARKKLETFKKGITDKADKTPAPAKKVKDF